tara:strand:+ start:108 stop:632 length:525 start_codon:yes stop_codon:yes gene_type:complete
MFGLFRNKKKELIDQFFKLINAVMGTYAIMRSLSSHRFKATKLDSSQMEIFEACYILGVIDCISHGVDSEEEVIGQEVILDACEICTVGLNIFDEKDAGGIFGMAILLIAEGNAAHKLQYHGGTDAQKCLNAMLDGEDSSVAAKAMGLKYLDDKKLIASFKKLWNSSFEGLKDG